MARIVVSKISKEFRKENSQKGFLAHFFSLFSGKRKGKSPVLKDISFNVNEGEIVGIIGGNGSGKSTLLRTIAGIYQKDNGNIEVKGNLISLISLFTGIEDMLTTGDNIRLLCALFGLNKGEIAERFKDILEFSQLKDFLHTKLYKFSNGMLQKLVFSVVVHCNPDILLLDEVFEFGDEAFREKSISKMKELLKKGVSIILVSHNLETIGKYCDRVLWIENGQLKMEGSPDKVIREYLSKKRR